MNTNLSTHCSINEQLDSLFEKWIIAIKQNNQAEEVPFTKDGLMLSNNIHIDIEKMWNDSGKRILFLVKDQPTQWADDARLWLKDCRTDNADSLKRKENNRLLKPKFIHNLANLFWGLSKSDNSHCYSYEECAKHLDSVRQNFNTQPFALVECKKQGGNTSISNNDLLHHIRMYWDFLKEEIRILNPNIIVCTNEVIYEFVVKMYDSQELTIIPRHNSIRIHPKSHTIILCSFHPSARMSYKKFYNGVMDHYSAYLNSIH